MMIVLLCLGTYVVASIPFGLLVVQLVKGVDVRQHGSGNIGATNVFRVGGAFAGIVTLLLDAAKGFLPVFIAQQWYPQTEWLHVAVAFIALLGHTLSLFLKFKGGKGVATALGVFLALLPLHIGIAAVVFAVALFVSGYVSLGSVLAAITLPLATLIMPAPLWYAGFALVAAVLVIAKHRANIGRLRAGTENKMVWRGAKK
ncbi:glycerol-3-phosphate 1-O-acyltransferase PlsY [Chrysiogenes arsenatis]|uniref:glycerol-3-phosphate 1-O-acyltransferase PlsY n=1 Tax=Chrysiogenes arsenatis TaxID=309797 RepID=UPI000400AB5D|nr:glycerol-3-phosphate 1-O-acyltransferase PlsY [Chrysiogenes arsenatis]